MCFFNIFISFHDSASILKQNFMICHVSAFILKPKWWKKKGGWGSFLASLYSHGAEREHTSPWSESLDVLLQDLAVFRLQYFSCLPLKISSYESADPPVACRPGLAGGRKARSFWTLVMYCLCTRFLDCRTLVM